MRPQRHRRRQDSTPTADSAAGARGIPTSTYDPVTTRADWRRHDLSHEAGRAARLLPRDLALLGDKARRVTPGKSPITIQTKVEPVQPPGLADPCLEPADCCPPERRLSPTTASPAIAIDPIGGRSAPYKSRRECRAALQGDGGGVTQTAVNALKECHRRVMTVRFLRAPAPVNGTSDPGGFVAAALGALQEAVSRRLPGDRTLADRFRLRRLPGALRRDRARAARPGIVGNSCARDRECDTAPGAHDGVCGDWGDSA